MRGCCERVRGREKVKTKSVRRVKSPSKIRDDGREIIGMIQSSGIHRMVVTAAPVPMAGNLPDGADRRELHLEICEDGRRVKSASLSRGMAEALIGLLRAGMETL